MSRQSENLSTVIELVEGILRDTRRATRSAELCLRELDARRRRTDERDRWSRDDETIEWLISKFERCLDDAEEIDGAMEAYLSDLRR